MQMGPQRPESLIGRVIAGYELTDYIGTGATGLVFRGKRLAATGEGPERTGLLPINFPEDAAIKLLVPPLGATQDELDEFQRRFLREARTLKGLEHPHILPLVDYGEDADAGYFYMILQYMAGGNLAQAIAKRGPLPLTETATLLTQIADALDYAHARNIVHRDVKPGNILLAGDGTPYLSDFSIVLVADSGTLRTTTGRMMGTPAYMAPEQFDDSSKVGPAADIYGLGMVTYELVTGRAAFGGTSWAQVMRQQLQEPPTAPREARTDLPEPANAAIMMALAKEPEARFKSAGAFASAFAQGVQGQWTPGLTAIVTSDAARRAAIAASYRTTEPAGGSLAPSTPPRRKLTPLAALSAAVVLLLVGTMGALAVRGFGGKSSTKTVAQVNTATPYPPTITVGPGTPTPTPYPPTATPNSGAGTGGQSPTALPTTTATPTVTPTPIPQANQLFGNGQDGSVDVAGGQTFYTDFVRTPLSAVNSGQTTLPVGSASGFSPSRLVLIIQTQGIGSGTYEFATIQGVGGSSLTLTAGLAHSYGGGAQVIWVPDYQDVTVENGGVITAHTWDGSTGGIVAFQVNGTLQVQGGGAIRVDGLGFRGAVMQCGSGCWTNFGYNGESYTGVSLHSSSNNAGGGAGGCDYQNQGGSGGGYGTAGGVGGGNNCGNAANEPGAVYGDVALNTLFLGSGGGSAGGCCVNGGNGAGAIAVFARTINNLGAITATGANGQNGGTSSAGAGGSGGSIKLVGETVSLGSNQILANGGAGGPSTGTYISQVVVGGAGGAGRIGIGYCSSISGYSTPSAFQHLVSCSGLVT